MASQTVDEITMSRLPGRLPYGIDPTQVANPPPAMPLPHRAARAGLVALLLAAGAPAAHPYPLGPGLAAAAEGDASACAHAMANVLKGRPRAAALRAAALYWLGRCAAAAGDAARADAAWRRLATRHRGSFHAIAAGIGGVRHTPNCHWLLGAIEHVESRGRLDAVSHRGARGPMQILPGTARELLAASGYPPEEAFAWVHDRSAAAWLALRYLERSLERHGGDLVTTLYAYNAGDRRAARWRARRGAFDPVLAIDRIRIGETRRYVRRVIERAWAGWPGCNGHAALEALRHGAWPRARPAG